MWIPRTGGTCGFQEQGEHVDSITGGTWGFQEQGEHVDSKNRGNQPNMWISRTGEIEHVDSKNRGNSNLWVPSAGEILNCGFQEQGEF